MKIKSINQLNSDNFRNIIFGAEDSLVSTVGVLFGVASASYENTSIVLTGLVVVAVEALSMGAGAFLSEKSTACFEPPQQQNERGVPLVDGIIMFLSYFFTGLIPLLPYMFWGAQYAKFVSVIFSFIALFLLGYLPAKKTVDALRMVVVAGFAVTIGFLIGHFAQGYIG